VTEEDRKSLMGNFFFTQEEKHKDFLLEYIDFFEKISEITTIAGGSMVYALNSNFVPPNSVGDIDFFCKPKDFKRVVEYILDFFGRDRCITKFIYYDTKNTYNVHAANQYLKNGYSSVANIYVEHLSIDFQVICTRSSKDIGVELIRKFDIDAVQCGLYKNEIIQTDICKEAHTTRTVRYVDLKIRIHRLLKMNEKGQQYYSFAL
jgi:hypothetical protein